MKYVKLTIIINEKHESTTMTSAYNMDETMNDIVKSAIKECTNKPQKFVIVMQGGKDNGNAKLSAYNEKMLKKPINIVLEECFNF